MTKPARQWDQDLPPWVRGETGPKPRAGKPAAKPKRAVDAEVARLRAAAAVKPEPLRLHVRVLFSGSITFVLEGEDANKLRSQLGWDKTLPEEIIDALDPWSSGANVTQDITILEDPPAQGAPYRSWDLCEEPAKISTKSNSSRLVSPFFYAIKSGKPHHVDWNQVGGGNLYTWELTPSGELRIT